MNDHETPGSAPLTVLVLGGTGKTGRRVAELLAGAGNDVRTAARNPGPAGGGITPVRFDWDDPAGHAAALEGVDAVYVVPPALVIEHAEPVAAFARRAAAAGVGRAVFLSARGVDTDDSIPLRRTELALLASDLPTTVIRPSWFAQNFTEGVFAAGVEAGVVATPAGDGLEPFIDADDIAAVAAHLLVTPGHAGAAYDLSGSEAITFGAAAALLSERLGREIRHVDITAEQFVAGAVAGGVPADYAAMLAGLFDIIRQGWDASVSDGVERVLGRPARSFADWAGTLSPVG